MASDRGSYRPIPAVLLDGKDFQKLSPIARWVFVALKISFGPTGIEVQYRRALVEQLAEQTGHPSGKVSDALDDLAAGGWVQFDGNVVWITRQLRFDPNMRPNDPKHRKSIQRHVMGLPRLPIVARFIEDYPDWFPADEFTAPEGLARVSEGSSKGLATTEDREPITDNRIPKTDLSSDKSDQRAAVERVFNHWVTATGRTPSSKLTDSRKRRIEGRLKSFTAEQLEKAIDGVMLSDHHRQKPEWTDLVSCFQTDEKVENHLARATAKPNGGGYGNGAGAHGGRTEGAPRAEAPGANPNRRRGWEADDA